VTAPARFFNERYGFNPAATWFAPGRVNLLGGPDYNEVFVLPFALGAGVYAAASPRSDRQLTLTSSRAGGDPVVLDIDALEPGSVTGWAAYPAGVAWALREAGYLGGGADVAIDADLPAGAGLSSSAALECSVALALTGLYQVTVPRRELAALARRAENEFAGVPTGIMDQFAALLGQAGHALLLDCRSGTETAVPLDPAAAGLTLLVIDTRVRHAVGDGQYGNRRQACEAAASELGVRSLRDVVADPGAPARLADPALRSVCEHVIAENGRVLRVAELLRAGDQAAVGDLLTASHRSLSYRFRMSWPQADAAVEAAIDHGALGARMTGGGFGGSVVTLVPASREAAVRTAVSRRFGQRGWPAPHYLAAVPSDGARRVLSRDSLLAGEDGVDHHRVVHRRDAHPVPRQAEVGPVDLECAVQHHLALGGGDLRVEGGRAGGAAHGEAARDPDAPVGRAHAIDGEGEVRVVGDVEEVGRAQVLVPGGVLRVDRLGGHGDDPRNLSGRRHGAVPGDLPEGAMERTKPPRVPALQPDLGLGRIQRPGPGELAVLQQRLQLR
jgi:galactokinase